MFLTEHLYFLLYICDNCCDFTCCSRCPVQLSVSLFFFYTAADSLLFIRKTCCYFQTLWGFCLPSFLLVSQCFVSAGHTAFLREFIYLPSITEVTKCLWPFLQKIERSKSCNDIMTGLFNGDTQHSDIM